MPSRPLLAVESSDPTLYRQVMGMFSTRWEAQYLGHAFTVTRSELSRGYAILVDGQQIAKRSWSLVGTGTLHGTVELSGRPVAVDIALKVGGKCELSVDGQAVECPRIG